MHFLHLALGVSRFFLKMTTDPPSCCDCVHFIPDKLTPFSNEKQCRKYSQINIFTGVISHRDAMDCRINDDLCGLDGTYFEPKNTTTTGMVNADMSYENNFPLIPDYYEEQLVKIRLGFFVCHIIFNAVFWITFGDLMYLHLWM